MPTAKKKTVKELDLRSLARSYTTKSVQTLGAWATASEVVDPDIRLRAISILLDRGWGKPQQDTTHVVTGEIKVVLRQMLEDDDDAT